MTKRELSSEEIQGWTALGQLYNVLNLFKVTYLTTGKVTFFI